MCRPMSYHGGKLKACSVAEDREQGSVFVLYPHDFPLARLLYVGVEAAFFCRLRRPLITAGTAAQFNPKGQVQARGGDAFDIESALQRWSERVLCRARECFAEMERESARSSEQESALQRWSAPVSKMTEKDDDSVKRRE